MRPRLFCLLLLLCTLAPCRLLSPCPQGCCCPRPGVLVLCESLGLHELPRSVPVTASALSVARNRLCNMDHVLRRFSSLQELSLSHNWLERFPRGLPPSLESLQLQENRITYITAGVLRHLGNLTRLDLEDNRIRAIQPGALLGLDRLRVLSLKGNRLSSLPQHLPSSLTHLDVSDNCIVALDPPSLATLVNLQVLKINSNCLRSVPEHAFDGLPRLRSVELANNLWVCECDIMYLYRWLLTDRMKMATDLVCAAPLHLAHKLLLTLSVLAICPKVLKPNERLAPPNTTAASQTMLENPAVRILESPSSEESADPPSNGSRSSLNFSVTSDRTLLSAPGPHSASYQSTLDGLRYEHCLLLNSTYLAPQSTQAPLSPAPDEEPVCGDDASAVQPGLPSTVAPSAAPSPAGEAGTVPWVPPRLPARSSDPALIALLSVLCVLTGLLLLTAFLVLKSLLWRNRRIAPLPS
uniref:LRRCT domain-containing protein n=1 Tax=Electrophorus electricus TaxID=8005 RepID=A0A4W4HL99_ELEEL